MPLGSSSDLFKFGGAIDANTSYIPERTLLPGIGAGARVALLPVETSGYIRVLAGYGGPAVKVPVTQQLALLAQGSAGYYLWNTMDWSGENNNGGDLMLRGSLTALIRLNDRFSLGAGPSYDYYFNLYNGIGIDIYLDVGFPVQKQEKAVRTRKEEPGIELLKQKGKGIIVEETVINPIFPVLYKYYDTMPIGSLNLINTDKTPAENISIQFFVERYMDNPMAISENFSLNPGEERQVDLFGLFTEDLMEITEGTKASARITISYLMDDTPSSIELNPVVEFYNRNALSWDDDRKIASFITAKDPEILGFAKNVMSWIQAIKNPAVDDNFQKGLALFEAVKAYGIRYEIDPSTPFTEYSEDVTSIDFLQFPRQTLLYTNGDCDDLSALYTALLEAIGVETAVITVPGHIYAAFALEMTPDEARKSFSQPDNLIFQADKVWIPVEITMFQETFDSAWNTGAKEWREHNSRKQARIYPTREAWRSYQPVGFREGSSNLLLPDRSEVETAFLNSIQRHVEREIYPQAARIQQRIASSETPYKQENSLAVLYARYGLYDKALKIFDSIAAEHSYPPALINAGNIYFVLKNYVTALDFYNRALLINGNNKSALLASARCNHELENYGIVKSSYAALKTLDPDLAMRFAYLDLRGEESQRAADATGLKDIVLWDEEDE